MKKLLLAAIAIIGLGLPAFSQSSHQTVILTTSTSALATGTATVTSTAYALKPGSGVAIVPAVTVATGGTAGNVTFNFQASADGTNWSSAYPASYTMAAAASGTVATTTYGFVNLDATGTAGLGNIKYIRLGQAISTVTGTTAAPVSFTITAQRPR